MFSCIFYDLQETPKTIILTEPVKVVNQDGFKYIGKNMIPAIYIFPMSMENKCKAHWEERKAAKEILDENTKAIYKLTNEKHEWIHALDKK